MHCSPGMPAPGSILLLVENRFPPSVGSSGVAGNPAGGRPFGPPSMVGTAAGIGNCAVVDGTSGAKGWAEAGGAIWL